MPSIRRFFSDRFAATAALGLAVVALVGVRLPASHAQQLTAAPIVESAWPGFGSDFAPDWRGVTKRVDWPVGYPHPGGGGGIIITIGHSDPPRPTPPIELVHSLRESVAWASTVMQGVVATSEGRDNDTGGGQWSPSEARYGEILNLQDVLLGRGTAATQQQSHLSDTSLLASGRVLATAEVHPAAPSPSQVGGFGKSTISATYKTTVPIWFELGGEISGAGSLNATMSLVNASNEPLFTFTPQVDELAMSWKVAVSGTLPPGVFTVNLSVAASASIGPAIEFDPATNDPGGLGEYALSFAASPRPFGDANGDGAVNRTDLNQWRSGYGFSPSGDLDGDGAINGSDFLLWQTPDFYPLSATRRPISNTKPWENGFRSQSGDLDGDGDADGSDFLMWQRRLGAQNATPIPEPATGAAALALGVAAATLLRRRLAS